ncbi:MAG: ribonuclease E/G [Lachnospiraceae bacterium]|nr:ribonuclease E/G [Lachnospiraceae bacterium]
MGKILITRIKDKIITAFHDGNTILDLKVSDIEDSVRNGDIYVGYVENIVKNLNAAFIEIRPKVKGYLDLNDNTEYIFINPKKNDRLRIGDKILLQVIREPIKSKPVTLSSEINLSGKKCVLLGKDAGKITISSKIKDEDERNRLLAIGEDLYKYHKRSAILRTNCIGASESSIKDEYKELSERFNALIKRATVGIKDECLVKGIPAYLSLIRDLPETQVDGIITDVAELYEEIKEYLEVFQKEDLDKLDFYSDDNLSLSALYCMESALKKATDKYVWLKSGAYLVVEYTEAMTVVDVNSGKAVKGKGDFEETALKLNMEAADELLYQLRLRNLSGMIIVDFISMKSEENKEKLFSYIKEKCKGESVKTDVLDITRLGLMEITRKRQSRPVHECI